jgi:hypothetical protein
VYKYILTPEANPTDKLSGATDQNFIKALCDLSQHHFFLVAVHLHFSRPQNATTVPVILVADSSVPSKVTGRGPLELLNRPGFPGDSNS